MMFTGSEPTALPLDRDVFDPPEELGRTPQCPMKFSEPIALPIDRDVFDPPEELGRLREQTPLCPMKFADGHVGWLVTSHELAREVLGDPRFSLHPIRSLVVDPERKMAGTVDSFSQDARMAEIFDQYVASGAAAHEALSDPKMLDIMRSDPPGSESLFIDPPRHTQLRRSLAGYFTPRRANEHQQLVEDIVSRRLDAMEKAGGPLDLIETFAGPIPSQMICAMLGASPEDHERFEQPSMVAVDPDSTAQQRVEARRAFDEFARELIQQKRAHPGDDMLSELILKGQLSDEDLVGTTMFLFQAGHETTRSMLGLSVLTLLRDRTRWDALRANPGMIDTAVEEMLRFHTLLKLSAFVRTAVEDVELAGHTIRAGEAVAVSLAAANRDPERFANADQVDLERKDVRGHLGFGHGIHQCLGQHFARLELRVGLTALASRFPDLRLAVPIDEVPQYPPAFTIHGVHRLPVTW